MPSDDRVRQAIIVFDQALRAFHSSLAATADEVRAYLAPRQSTWEGQLSRIRAELGPLADGRIDAERFATTFAPRRQVDPGTLHAVEGALETLTAVAAQGTAPYTAAVPPGGSLYDAVARGLSEIGRVFSAARLVHDVRRGLGTARRNGGPAPLPFAEWTRNERRVAPPLVVAVGGADLRAPALVEFLDGRQKLVLVVEGECAPAPLARLVGPGTFVLQAKEPAGLARLAAFDGPGIAALVPDSAARFVHDPTAPADRLTIDFLPDNAPRKVIAGLSPAQQMEELALLRAIAATRAASSAGSPGGKPAADAPAGAEPADKLAAWLLSQVNLADLG